MEDAAHDKQEVEAELRASVEAAEQAHAEAEERLVALERAHAEQAPPPPPRAHGSNLGASP